MEEISEKKIASAINMINYRNNYYKEYYKKPENKIKRDEIYLKIKQDPEKYEMFKERKKIYYIEKTKKKNDEKNQQKKNELLKLKNEILEAKRKRHDLKYNK